METLIMVEGTRLGNLKLNELTPSPIVLKYRDKLSNGKIRPDSTFSRNLTSLGHVFNTACQEWHWINTRLCFFHR